MKNLEKLVNGLGGIVANAHIEITPETLSMVTCPFEATEDPEALEIEGCPSETQCCICKMEWLSREAETRDDQ